MKKNVLLVSFLSAMLLAANTFAMPEMAGMQGSEPSAKQLPISGKILESVNSSSYTYLLLEMGGLKQWVAIPELFVTVGEEVELEPGVQMGDFKSTPLNRTFEHILFSSGPTDKYNEKRKVNAHKGVDMNAPAPGKKKSEAKLIEGLKVEKVPGANSYTLAEVILKRDELQNRIITVRGQVVKSSEGIMGRNWVHIKDGSDEKGENKLVVTTKGSAEVGTVVTATGVFHNNVDFGGGYKYSIIMEDAELK